MSFTWFTDHREEGDPKCLCSFCKTPIPELNEDGDPYVAIRLFKNNPKPASKRDRVLQARFHDGCFTLLLQGGDITLQQNVAGRPRMPGIPNPE